MSGDLKGFGDFVHVLEITFGYRNKNHVFRRIDFPLLFRRWSGHHKWRVSSETIQQIIVLYSLFFNVRYFCRKASILKKDCYNFVFLLEAFKVCRQKCSFEQVEIGFVNCWIWQTETRKNFLKIFVTNKTKHLLLTFSSELVNYFSPSWSFNS